MLRENIIVNKIAPLSTQFPLKESLKWIEMDHSGPK